MRRHTAWWQRGSWGWVVGLAVWSWGCSGGPIPCAADGECESGQCVEGYCTRPGEAAEPREEPGEEVAAEPTCDPVCDEFADCEGTTCITRYTGVELFEPKSGDVFHGDVPVRVRLQARDGRQVVEGHRVVLHFTPTTSEQVVMTDVAVDAEGDGLTHWLSPQDGEYSVSAHFPPLALSTTPVIFRVNGPPNLSIALSAPPNRARPDDRDPHPDYASAYRRDEFVTVSLSSDAPDVAPATLQLQLMGAGEPIPVPFSLGAPTCRENATLCATARIDLATVPMPSLRAAWSLRATVQDGEGNERVMDAPLRVTRWKWKANFSPGTKVLEMPALAEGRVVVATAGTQAGVHRFSPEGYLDWTATGQTPTGAPALLQRERIWFPVKGGAMSVAASNGAVAVTCAHPNMNALRPFRQALKVVGGLCGPSLGAPRCIPKQETVEFVAVIQERDSRVRVLRCPNSGAAPSYPEPGKEAVDLALAGMVGYVDWSAQAVTSDSHFWIPMAAIRKDEVTFKFMSAAVMVRRSLQFDGQLSTKLVIGSDPVDLEIARGSSGAGVVPVGVAWAGNTVWTLVRSSGASKLLHRLEDSDPVSTSTTFSTGPLLDASLNPFSVGPSGVLAMSRQNATWAQWNPANQQLTTTPGSPQGLAHAPVLGQGGYMYGLTREGALEVQNPGRQLRWTVEGMPELPFDKAGAAPTLDCARDASGTAIAGRPGTLFVPLDSGLVALIADSRGIDATAPWPLPHRDPQNTRSITTPIQACP